MSRQESKWIWCEGQLVVLLSVLVLLSCARGQNSESSQRSGANGNHANFQPSKDFPGNNSGSHGVNTRYFHHPNSNQFYNPHSYSVNKFNNFFYPSHPIPSLYPGYGGTQGHFRRQIRVPGIMEIRIDGRNAQITCEFERYLILVQGIYWHHNVEPFGSYFDTRNGFAPHVHIVNTGNYKSILTITDFTQDDFGSYRCISTALLPDTNVQQNLGYAQSEIRSNNVPVPNPTKRKVRFARQLKEETQFNSVYDPFYNNFLGLNYNSNPQPLLNQPPTHQTYVPNINVPHSNYYNPNYLGNQQFNPFTPNTGYYEPDAFHGGNAWNVHAPYYKPSYSYSIVYQEVSFGSPNPGTTIPPGK